jgi:hypothetical protein
MRFWGCGKWLLFIALALNAGACARHHVADLKTVAGDGISLVYDAFYFQGCENKKTPRLTSQENGDGVPVEVFPERTILSLKDKRPLPALAKGPRYFFPVFSQVQVIPLTDPGVKDFGLAYPGLFQASQKLGALLQKRPALPVLRQDIPDLAEVDCERAIISKPQFLDFKSGSGIVFLTQYGQDFQAINNEELACVFQGLTSDRQYYISARLAVGHPTLDRGIDTTHPVPAPRQAKYLKHIQQELDYFPESSFNPPLQDLKSMLASLAFLGISRTAQAGDNPQEVLHGATEKNQIEKNRHP